MWITRFESSLKQHRCFINATSRWGVKRLLNEFKATEPLIVVDLVFPPQEQIVKQLNLIQGQAILATGLSLENILEVLNSGFPHLRVALLNADAKTSEVEVFLNNRNPLILHYNNASPKPPHITKDNLKLNLDEAMALAPHLSIGLAQQLLSTTDGAIEDFMEVVLPQAGPSPTSVVGNSYAMSTKVTGTTPTTINETYLSFLEAYNSGQAAQLVDPALQALKKQHHPKLAAIVGEYLALHGQPAIAEELLEKAMAAEQSYEVFRSAARVAQLKSHDFALSIAKKTLEIAERNQISSQIGEGLTRVAEVLGAMGQYQMAMKQSKKSLSYLDPIGPAYNLALNEAAFYSLLASDDISSIDQLKNRLQGRSRDNWIVNATYADYCMITNPQEAFNLYEENWNQLLHSKQCGMAIGLLMRAAIETNRLDGIPAKLQTCEQLLKGAAFIYQRRFELAKGMYLSAIKQHHLALEVLTKALEKFEQNPVAYRRDQTMFYIAYNQLALGLEVLPLDSSLSQLSRNGRFYLSGPNAMFGPLWRHLGLETDR